MDALETLMRPFVNAINRNIAEVTRARELCAELSGTVAAVRVRDTALTMVVNIHDDHVTLSGLADEEPDIIISGSLIALARLAASGDNSAIRNGDVELVGDAEQAQAFQELLSVARPDPEEELSHVVGDAAAHSVGELARNIGQWAIGARATMGSNIREYLQEESRDVPAREEVEDFGQQINVLRDDVERLAARIDRLRDGG